LIIYRGPAGFDRTRNAVIGNKDFDLTYFEEVYTSEHWLVRIYRVKKPDEFNRPSLKPLKRTGGADAVSRKVSDTMIYYNFSPILILPFSFSLILLADIKTKKRRHQEPSRGGERQAVSAKSQLD
jgi:hypothetical protein